MKSILDLTPETYQANRIHTQERDWAETNCYVDIWVELLHAMGKDPRASLAYTIGIDFEGDQWTFFKFPLNDLRELYGLEVQELAVWRPLVDHVEEQVAQGRPVLVELDSFFLPDTHGTAYKMANVKSTVAVNEIDIENKMLGYFHGQGYYRLYDEDFVNVFRLENEDTTYLPPYIEFVKTDQRFSPTSEEMKSAALEQLKKQLNWLPEENPFSKYTIRLQQDLDWLVKADLEVFHQYSFATLRQFGACFELSTHYFQWLEEQGETDLQEVIKHFKTISELAKVYQFQLARAITRKKNLDTSPIGQMSQHWEKARDLLSNKYL